MSTVAKTVFTADQYLASERKASFKSHFFRGETFAMAGASREHNLISLNLAAELRNALKSKDCEVYPADMRLALDVDCHYSYPDAIAVCGKPEFIDDRFDTLLNPTLVVEVLSESTATYDLTTKFNSYLAIPSLKAICFIHQDQSNVLVYSRGEAGTWILRTTSSLSADVAFPLHDIRIAMSEIYRGLTFETDSKMLRPKK